VFLFQIVAGMPQGRYEASIKENRKKAQKTSGETSSPQSDAPDFEPGDEIDPADVFHPEEFGVRRRNFKSPHP
jgi:hypothetical protein